MVKTLSGVTNFTVSDTLKVKKVSANNSLGTNGQVLTTNGSATYWATPVSEVAVNTAAQYVWTNTHIFNANVTVNAALIANGSPGTAGQVLHSNGSAIYWAADDFNVNTTYDLLAVANTEANKGIIRLKDVNNSNDDVYVTGAGGVVVSSNASHILITGAPGDITGVNAGDGLTGTASSGEATLSVLANTGIVANTSGTFVNAAYIATLNANNASYLGGVAAASYLQNTDSRTLSGNLVISGTQFNPSSNTVLLGNSTARWVLSTNTINSSGDITTAANITANYASISTDLYVGRNVAIQGNLTIYGTSTTLQGNTITFSDNMLYLNQGILATITGVSGNGTYVTFTANNNYQAGWDVLVTGVNPSSYNGAYQNIFAANATHFQVANTNTASYISGGTARGKTDQNPDLGLAAGYNDGTYHHTGIFRDASDGYWKVFDGYLPEPDASINIDTSNTSFNIAGFWSGNTRIGNTTVYTSISNFGINFAASGYEVNPTGARFGFYNGGGTPQTYMQMPTGGEIVFWTPGTAEIMRIANNNNVGIGTTTPGTKLEVSGGDFRVSQAGSGNIGVNIVRSGGTASDWYNYIPSGSADLVWWRAGERVRITSDGNVGIGLGNPTASLHIKGPIGDGKISIQPASGGRAYNLESIGGSHFRIYDASAGLERLRIDFNGNVGIGTNSPSALLDVLGYSYTGTDTNNSFFVNSNSSVVTVGAAGRTTFSTSALRFITSDGSAALERMRITSAGDVLVGATTNSWGAKLYVKDLYPIVTIEGTDNTTRQAALQFGTAGGNWSIVNSNDLTIKNGAPAEAITTGSYAVFGRTTGPLILGTTGVERMRIDSTGIVGIGTIPSAWNSVMRAIQIGSGGSLANWTGSNGSVSLNANLYDVGGGVQRYINTAGSASFDVDTGSFAWRIAGSGTAGNVITFTTAMALNSSGDLGIGISSPSSRLDVRGIGSFARTSAGAAVQVANFQNLATDTNSAVELVFNNTTAFNGNQLTKIGFVRVNSPNAGDTDMYINLQHNGATQQRLYLNSSGNLGVGTNSPSKKLTIVDTDTQNYIGIGNSMQSLAPGTRQGGAIYFGVGVSGSTVPTAAIETSWGPDGPTNVPQIHIGVTRDGKKTRYSAFYDDYLAMYTGNTERVRITSDGNIGFGTSSPVNYPGYTSLTIGSGSSVGLIKLRSPYNSGNGAEIFQLASGWTYFNTNSSATWMVSDNAGNVGIGTVSPSAKVHIKQGNDNIVSGIRVTRSSNDAQYGLFANYGGATFIGTVDSNNAGNQILVFNRSSDGSAFSESMRISAAGNLLLGSTVDGDTFVIGDKAGGADIIQMGVVGTEAHIDFGTNNAGTTAATLRYSRSTGALTYGTGTTDSFTERFRISAGGNVGIGTNDPLVKLDVYGTRQSATIKTISNLFDTQTANVDVGAGIGFGGKFDGTNYAHYALVGGRKENNTGGNYAGYLVFETRPNGLELTERMRIASNGNVGIGTTNPANKLQVDGNVTFNGARPIFFDPALGSIKIKGDVGGWETGLFFLGSSATLHGGFGALGSGDALTYYFVGSSYSNAAIYVLPNNNVGIGVSNPSNKLHVLGTGQFGTNVANTTPPVGIFLNAPGTGTGDASPSIKFDVGGGGGGASIYTTRIGSAGGNLIFTTDNTSGTALERMRIDSSGTLTLTGTTDKKVSFVRSGANTFSIEHDTARIYFWNATTSNNVLTFTNDSRVGVGTPNPVTKFEVNGAGKFFSTDARGLYIRGRSDGDDAAVMVYQTNANNDQASIAAVANSLRFYTANSSAVLNEHIRITTGGNVGIGVTNPNYKLDVNGEIAIRGGESADDARVYFQASDNSNRFTIETDLDGTTGNDLLIFRSTSADNTLVIKGNGRVGVNTDNPQATLDVNGEVRALSISGYNLSNNAATIDTGLVPTDFTILEAFGSANPNSDGSSNYRDPIHLYIYKGTGWNGSAVTDYVYAQSVAPPARSAFPSGSGSSINENMSVVWVKAGVESDSCPMNDNTYSLRIKISNYTTTSYFSLRIVRRF